MFNSSLDKSLVICSAMVVELVRARRFVSLRKFVRFVMEFFCARRGISCPIYSELASEAIK